MMKINAKKWLVIYFCIQISILICFAGLVAWIDPWMNYHKPLTKKFYYNLDQERLLDFGMSKNLDFNALITGTSMTENFKVSEFDDEFGVNAIKLPVAGGKFKNINSIVETALEHHPNTRYVIRGLDISLVIGDEDGMSTEDVTYPMYLINDNPFDDINYLLNKEAIMNYCGHMIIERCRGNKVGITSFDDYGRWNDLYQFGKEYVLTGHAPFVASTEPELELTASDRERIKNNIDNNVMSVVENYPDTQFYYFFTPYSVAYWGELYQRAEIKKQVEILKYASQIMLDRECSNIHLFDYTAMLEITDDLDNYKDAGHYGEKINSLILKYMHEGTGELKKENYKQYFENEYAIYSTFDYNSIF